MMPSLLSMLPSEYIQYLQQGERTYGFTDLFCGYFQLEPLESIVQLNTDFDIERSAAGFLLFGTNGGGELYAFDLHGAVFLIPAVVPTYEDAIQICNSWAEFQVHIQID